MEEGKEGPDWEEYRPEHLTYFGERKAEGVWAAYQNGERSSMRLTWGDADADFNTSRG